MRKQDFKCKRCGDCCRHFVVIKKSDINRIKKAGYDEREFVIVSPFHKGRKCIKLVENRCFFLVDESPETSCRIYEFRPDVCQDYPFFGKKIESCRPKVLFP